MTWDNVYVADRWDTHGTAHAEATRRGLRFFVFKEFVEEILDQDTTRRVGPVESVLGKEKHVPIPG